VPRALQPYIAPGRVVSAQTACLRTCKSGPRACESHNAYLSSTRGQLVGKPGARLWPCPSVPRAFQPHDSTCPSQSMASVFRLPATCVQPQSFNGASQEPRLATELKVGSEKLPGTAFLY